MADIKLVCQQVRCAPDVVYSSLALNTKGVERAAKAAFARHRRERHGQPATSMDCGMQISDTAVGDWAVAPLMKGQPEI